MTWEDIQKILKRKQGFEKGIMFQCNAGKDLLPFQLDLATYGANINIFITSTALNGFSPRLEGG